MPLRVEVLATIKLLGTCIRIGRTRTNGPVFHLVKFDHTRGVFTARNIHTGATDTVSAEELTTALHEGIAHTSKTRGVIYHA